MIWTYVISIVLAIAWFLVLRYVAIREHARDTYKFIEISRGMVFLSIIALLIPILNILYFVVAPFAYIFYLDSVCFDIKMQVRENDNLSERVKSILDWLKESAFILIFILFVGCVPQQRDISNLPSASKIIIEYKYNENIMYPDRVTLSVVPFKQNNHDMIYYSGYNRNFCIVHSPDCGICKNKESVGILDSNW